MFRDDYASLRSRQTRVLQGHRVFIVPTLRARFSNFKVYNDRASSSVIRYLCGGVDFPARIHWRCGFKCSDLPVWCIRTFKIRYWLHCGNSTTVYALRTSKCCHRHQLCQYRQSDLYISAIGLLKSLYSKCSYCATFQHLPAANVVLTLRLSVDVPGSLASHLTLSTSTSTGDCCIAPCP